MYYQLASKFVVIGATGNSTQAVTLSNANALYATIQTISKEGSPSAGTAFLQISNDLENWTNVSGGSVSGIHAIGSTAILGTALGAQYARLQFVVTGTIVLAADAFTKNL